MPTPPRSPLPPWLASKAASSSPRSAATPTSSAPPSTQRATTSASPPPDHGRTAHPAWSPYGAKRAFHGLRRLVVNELGDLQLAGWWVGQSSLRVTAGYERERIERLNEARERLDRKEVAAGTATHVANESTKSLPRRVGARGFEPPTSRSRTRWR